MKEHFIDGREIHQIGDHVSVVWNTDGNKKRVSKKPYIDFLFIRQYSNKIIGVSENSSVAGGINIGQAGAITQELTEAIEYMKSLEELQKEQERYHDYES